MIGKDKRNTARPFRVVVFFGHHKVGSSALQTHLARIAPAALRQGVLYPAVTAQDLKLLVKQTESGAQVQRLSRNVTEAHNALAFSMLGDRTGAPIPAIHQGLPPTEEMFALIRRQIREFAPHTLVLASEVFANFAAVTPELIDELFRGLGIDKDSSQIELFAYLRRVDDYLASWHAQRVRFGERVRALPQGALGHYRKGIHFDYRLMVEGWMEQLPTARLVLQPYDQTVRDAGSSQFFSDLMGIDLPKLADADKQRVNVGLHRGLLDIARHANFELEPAERGKMFNALLRIGPDLDLPPGRNVELFGPRARAELAEHFAPIHGWLSDMRGQPFFEDIGQIGTCAPIDEFDVNQEALAQIRERHIGAFTSAGSSFIRAFEPARNFPNETPTGSKSGQKP
ncbi:hypothetical protein [Sinisalibacter lacisalsi]|nr:hypothetical protein [Sinisalibacter lacisalsi]